MAGIVCQEASASAPSSGASTSAVVGGVSLFLRPDAAAVVVAAAATVVVGGRDGVDGASAAAASCGRCCIGPTRLVALVRRLSERCDPLATSSADADSKMALFICSAHQNQKTPVKLVASIDHRWRRHPGNFRTAIANLVRLG